MSVNVSLSMIKVCFIGTAMLAFVVRQSSLRTTYMHTTVKNHRLVLWRILGKGKE